MAYVVSAVARPGHRAQRQDLQSALLRLALGLLQEVVEAAHSLLSVLGRTHSVAEDLGERPQRIELLGVGSLVDTVDERRLLERRQLAGDKLRHPLVGQQHKLLDEPVALLGDPLPHLYRTAFLVDLDLHLRPLEVHRAVVETVLAKDGGKVVQLADLGSQRPLVRLDDLLGLVIVETVVRIDDGAAVPLAVNLGVVVQLEYRRIAELVLVRTQRAELVAEVLRQHRHGAVHKIYRSGAVVGLLVDNVARLHIESDVGDMYSHLVAALTQLHERNGVVEVLGVGRVDGEGSDLAVVLALRNLRIGDGVGYLVGGLADLRFEAVRQLELRQDGVHLGVVLAGLSQHVHDLADGLHALAGPVGHHHGHLHSVGSLDAADFRKVFRAVDGNADVIGHTGALDDGPGLVAADRQYADVRPFAALQDLHHLTFLAARVVPLLCHEHLHPVAVQSASQLALRHENVVVAAFQHHEAEAVAG